LTYRVRDEQRAEAMNFEAGKSLTSGYHFVAIQGDPDSDEVEGFWLLRRPSVQ
ncbi:unnamed protein product, partial [Chrysoparadoxa australica]